MLGVRILLPLSRDPAAPDFPGGTERTTGEDAALSFVLKTVPGFIELIQGKTVLDFGCGLGWQAVAMAKRGAGRVVGLDIRDLTAAAANARQAGCAERVSFTNRLSPDELFDVVISCSSFEHFSDPGDILRQMRETTRPGGVVIITFAEPWYSPHGSHMNFFAKIPWVNLLFTERSVMEARSHFRSDGAQHYEQVKGGLNRMTIARFERLIRASGLKIDFLKVYPVKNLPAIGRMPIFRELLTGAATCILRKPDNLG